MFLEMNYHLWKILEMVGQMMKQGVAGPPGKNTEAQSCCECYILCVIQISNHNSYFVLHSSPATVDPVA